MDQTSLLDAGVEDESCLLDSSLDKASFYIKDALDGRCRTTRVVVLVFPLPLTFGSMWETVTGYFNINVIGLVVFH